MIGLGMIGLGMIGLGMIGSGIMVRSYSPPRVRMNNNGKKAMKIRVLKVPYDSGQRCERMAKGPGYLLSNQVLKGAAVESIETTLSFTSEIQTAFDLAGLLSARVREIREAGELPVVLAGNCNSAVGTISGLGPRRTGVVWFDAHGEFHTPETTRSGFLDGMPLAIVTGRCWRVKAHGVPGFEPVPEENVVLAGVRDTDPQEQAALDESSITQLRDLAGLDAALERVAGRVDHWYIHLDLDALDPSEATSNAWVPPGGLRARDVAEAIRRAAALRPIAGVGLASLDPACDGDGRALSIARELLAAACAAAGATT
jgi:arginase